MDDIWIRIFWVLALSFCESHRLSRQDSISFAKKYLYHHGYSNCSNSSSKYEVCSNESLQLALMKFQNNFNLRVTGYLNEETVKKMMIKRCNNMDGQNSDIEKVTNRFIKRRRRDIFAVKNKSILKEMKSLNKNQCPDVECSPPLEFGSSKKFLENSMRLPHFSTSNLSTRRKRSARQHKVIRWSYSNSSEVTLKYRVAVLFAHKSWSEIVPLKFYKTRKSEAADVEYTFKKGTFKSYVVRSGLNAKIHVNLAGNENIEHILIHSLGHFLGLSHIMDNSSVMYPLYESMNLEIRRQDQQLAQALHGKCSGRFDLVTNWLFNNASEYVTIFKRNNYCWVYNHALTRTLRGVENFCFFPPEANAALQFFKSDGSLESFAFEGPMYYKYDQFLPKYGYPRGLGDFGCRFKNGPTQVDAAFFDPIFVYLFKGQKVWLYDKEVFPSGSCPLHVVNLTDIFYPAVPGNYVDGPIDSMFQSHFFNAVLIFKGEDLYVVNSRQLNGSNKLPRYEIKRVGQWNDVYDNICEDE